MKNKLQDITLSIASFFLLALSSIPANAYEGRFDGCVVFGLSGGAIGQVGTSQQLSTKSEDGSNIQLKLWSFNKPHGIHFRITNPVVRLDGELVSMRRSDHSVFYLTSANAGYFRKPIPKEGLHFPRGYYFDISIEYSDRTLGPIPFGNYQISAEGECTRSEAGFDEKS